MSISRRLRFEVFKRDNFTCQYCGAKPPDTVLEVDHVHPRSLGGLDTMENLKTACWSCNRGKAHVPLTVARTYTFRGGPCDGRVFEIHLATQWPVVWVIRRHDGALAFFEDQLLYEEEDGDWGGQRIRFGHPGFGLPKQPHSGADVDYSQGPWNTNPQPVMLGVYWTLGAPLVNGGPPQTMVWADPERLIVELTS